MHKFKMEDDRQQVFSSSEPFCIEFPSDYSPSEALVEQPWEQQEESNKDEVTELTATIQELAISDDEEDDNHIREQDDELQRTDEESQCNVYSRPSISNAILDSDKDSDSEMDKAADNDTGMWLAIHKKFINEFVFINHFESSQICEHFSQ